MKLRHLESIVQNILLENDQARKNDFVLYRLVVEKTNPDIDFWEQSFDSVLLWYNDKLPPFESVTRCRRKIFKKMPELKPEKVTKAREEKEEEFKEYARS